MPWVQYGQSNHRPEGAKDLILNAFALSGRGMMDAWIYPQGVALGWVLLPFQGAEMGVPFGQKFYKIIIKISQNIR